MIVFKYIKMGSDLSLLLMASPPLLWGWVWLLKQFMLLAYLRGSQGNSIFQAFEMFSLAGLPSLLSFPFTLPCPRCSLPLPGAQTTSVTWKCDTARKPLRKHGQGACTEFEFLIKKFFCVIMMTLDFQELIPDLLYIIWIANITVSTLVVMLIPERLNFSRHFLNSTDH